MVGFLGLLSTTLVPSGGLVLWAGLAKRWHLDSSSSGSQHDGGGGAASRPLGPALAGLLLLLGGGGAFTTDPGWRAVHPAWRWAG